MKYMVIALILTLKKNPLDPINFFLFCTYTISCIMILNKSLRNTFLSRKDGGTPKVLRLTGPINLIM